MNEETQTPLEKIAITITDGTGSSARMRPLAYVFPILFLILLILWWTDVLKPKVIWHWNIAGNDLWIPRDYFEPKYFNPKEEGFSLEARHNDFSPVNKTKILSPDVRIGISNPKYYKPIEESLEGMKKHFEAIVNKGSQYGLTYFTQVPGNSKDWGELWVEKDGKKLISVIDCDKIEFKTKDGMTTCHQRFMHDGIYIELGYDKRQLSEWRYFKERSITLIDSFRTKPTGYITIIAVQPPPTQEK